MVSLGSGEWFAVGDLVNLAYQLACQVCGQLEPVCDLLGTPFVHFLGGAGPLLAVGSDEDREPVPGIGKSFQGCHIFLSKEDVLTCCCPSCYEWQNASA